MNPFLTLLCVVINCFKTSTRAFCLLTWLLPGRKWSSLGIWICNHGFFTWCITRYIYYHFSLLIFLCCIISNVCIVVHNNIYIGRKGVQGAEPGPVLSWNQRVKIAYGAARGLEYLHEKVQPAIVHRDVRSSNVLLFDDFVSKIADFNLGNQSSDTAARLHSTRVLGTFGYHAPE